MPPGATLQARFQPFEEQAELQQAWGNLTHALSGLFCASLNFLVRHCYLTAGLPCDAVLKIHTHDKLWLYYAMTHAQHV